VIARALERPVSTLLAALTVVVLGAFSLLRLPVSLLPALERPALTVTAVAPGSGRQEVLERVTRPLERLLAPIPGVTSVRSTTSDGAARLRVETDWQTDPDRLRLEAGRRLAGAEPAGGSLTVELSTGDALPIVEVAVFGGRTGAARTLFTREVLAPELARLPGAGRIETLGLAPLHPVVRPRAAALAARGLTPADLAGRLDAVGAARSAGRARAGGTLRPVLVREDAGSLADLGALRIAGPRGESVLADVAGVALEEVRDESFFRADGREGTLVRLFRAPEANAVALAARARQRAAELGRQAAGGLEVRVVTDAGGEVRGALRELARASLLGLALGIAALRLFLGRFRPALALAVAVPASMLATFSAFHLCGIALDLGALAGLALASGMLVDSSVVVLESIETARARGEARPELAGARQIALPVVAGLATTAVVFLPLIYVRGLARAFFGAEAFALVAALAASLLFSLTVTPVLARDRRAAPASAARSPGRAAYLRLLDGALARPAWPLAAGIAAAVLAAVALGALPRELVPAGEARELVVHYRLPADLAPAAARRQGGQVEASVVQALGGLPALRLASQQPADEAAAGPEGESGRIELRFGDPASAARALPRLRRELGRLPGVEARVEPQPSAFVAALARAGRRLEWVATAATPERAEALAHRAEERLVRAGLQPLSRHRGGEPRALFLSWDAPRLAALGADRGALESQVGAGLSERNAGRVRLPQSDPEIVVLPTAEDQPSLLPVALGEAGVVPLAALARLEAGTRPRDLEREDGRPAVRLAFDGTLAPGRAAVLLGAVARQPGETLRESGLALEVRRSFGELRLALGLSLLLVFLVVAALYESLVTPLVVMAALPVALGGALGLLALAGQSLNVLSFLGLILLSGLGVNNAIVLVHRIEDHRKSGLAADEAVRRAGFERYRPILMTTLTTVAGMLPLALAGGPGVELRRSLALAVAGGMVFSTFASLFLVPVLYRSTPRGHDAR
jgi:HAE1 family hydrophobic/amphiphilic exporter-1